MDDLAGRIGSILSDEESLKQIGELAKMLGLGEPPSPDNSAAPPAMLPLLDQGQQSARSAPQLPDMAAIMNIASALKNFNAEDDNIRFVMALKPLLSKDKQEKADRVVKILKLVNLIPLIKDSGLLGGDFLGIL